MSTNIFSWLTCRLTKEIGHTNLFCVHVNVREYVCMDGENLNGWEGCFKATEEINEEKILVGRYEMLVV